MKISRYMYYKVKLPLSHLLLHTDCWKKALFLAFWIYFQSFKTLTVACLHLCII